MNEFLAASAVVPSLLLIWYFRSRDVNPEPGRVVWATFFLGVLTVIPVLLVDSVITKILGSPADPIAKGFGEAFFVAGMPEEFFKFLVIWLYASRHKEFDEPMDGIVYGAVASLGFATLENVLYVSKGGVGVAIMRALTAVPGHAFMGAIAGYYIGQAKFDPQRRVSLLVRGYVYAVLIHGLYDAGLLSARAMSQVAASADGGDAAAVSGLVILTFATFLYGWIWSVRLVRRLRAQQFTINAQQQEQQQQAAMAAGANPWGAPQMPATANGWNPPPAQSPPGFAPVMAQSPYGAPPAPQQPFAPQQPYAQSPQSPYGAPNAHYAQQPYGQPPQPYAQQPYAQPSQPQYGAPPSNPYASPAQTYGHAPSGVYAPAGYAQPAAPGAGVGTWIQIAFGGVLGSIGGLVILGVLLAVASGGTADQDAGNLGIGTFAIGVLPLALGLFLFARGIKKVSASSRVPPQPYPAQYPAQPQSYPRAS